MLTDTQYIKIRPCINERRSTLSDIDKRIYELTDRLKQLEHVLQIVPVYDKKEIRIAYNEVLAELTKDRKEKYNAK